MSSSKFSIKSPSKDKDQSSVAVNKVDGTAIAWKHYKTYHNPRFDFPAGVLSQVIEINTSNYRFDILRNLKFYIALSKAGVNSYIGFNKITSTTIKDEKSPVEALALKNYSYRYHEGTWTTSGQIQFARTWHSHLLIWIVGNHATDHGSMKVFIDSDRKGILVNKKTAYQKFQDGLFTSKGLENDSHEVRFEKANNNSSII